MNTEEVIAKIQHLKNKINIKLSKHPARCELSILDNKLEDINCPEPKEYYITLYKLHFVNILIEPKKRSFQVIVIETMLRFMDVLARHSRYNDFNILMNIAMQI